MKCYRKNGSDTALTTGSWRACQPSMKCYRKNGSDLNRGLAPAYLNLSPSMKCYRKNGSDTPDEADRAAAAAPQ